MHLFFKESVFFCVGKVCFQRDTAGIIIHRWRILKLKHKPMRVIKTLDLIRWKRELLKVLIYYNPWL